MSEITAILSSCALVAVSEFGDKTQLLAFSLAARFKRPGAVMAGIFVATILNHALASTVGQWVAMQLSPSILAWILAATFIGFGLWTLKPDTLEEGQTTHRFGPFLTTTVLFFLAEMGDKTQLATVALAARYQSAIAVTIGTTLGMMITDGLAVFLGEKLASRVSRITMRSIRWFTAILFFIFGAFSIWTAVSSP